MKILVLNGSPKQNSNTLAITMEFLKGLNQTKEHQIEIINVIEKKINYCQGCLSCWMQQNIHCVMQDDMNELLDKMAESDAIVWSFPLYEYGLPGHMKTLLDRTNPFMTMEMHTEANRVIHNFVVDFPGKKNIIITGCGFPYFEDNFVPLRAQMKNVFVNSCMICIYESGLVTIPDPRLQPAKDKLFLSLQKAGAEYNQTGSISIDTLKEVEEPMLPTDMYIHIINSMVKQ